MSDGGPLVPDQRGITMQRDRPAEGLAAGASSGIVPEANVLMPPAAEPLAELEKRSIAAALTRAKGNRSRTDAALGLSRRHFYTRLRRFGPRYLAAVHFEAVRSEWNTPSGVPAHPRGTAIPRVACFCANGALRAFGKDDAFLRKRGSEGQFPQEDVEMSQRVKQVAGVLGSDPETTPTRIDRDRPLVLALRRREPTSAEQLVATYGDRAYRLAIRITGNDADAEEVVQDAFWSVVRKIETFKGESAFGSWLYRIVANAAYQKLRGRRVRRTDLSLDEVLPFFDESGAHTEAGDDWSPRVEDPSLQTELRAALTSAIDELPATYRAALVLHDVEGLSSGEIGEALRISVANVKSRVHRARLFLRKRLGDYMTTRRRGDRHANVLTNVRVAAANTV